MPASAPDLSAMRVLVLLNPGNTSRNYLVGIARAAERMGILASALELEPIWRQVAAAGVQAGAIRAQAAAQVLALCAERGVTHALGYTHNGVFDFGVFPDPAGGGLPVGLFASLGIPHILVWTDHPHWAAQASALEPQVARILAHPSHLHVVKSACAAAELRAICRWPRVIATTMGEDYDALVPAPEVAPLHDVVLIQSDAAPLSETLTPFLSQSDPDPSAIDQAHREPALRAVSAALRDGDDAPSETLCGAIEAFARALIAARIESPLIPWWRLAEPLRPAHADACAWLHADMRRWVRLTSALNTLVGWRRRFWPAWLSRHLNVGLYGSASEPIGMTTPPGAAQWVAYAQQPAIYARGRIALNINAGHDEEGLTHKPFQIAASGVACLHHDTNGLSDAFAPGAEVLLFTRGRELLNAARSLLSDDARRREIAHAMRERARRDHSWERFLERVLRAERSQPLERSVVESPA